MKSTMLAKIALATVIVVTATLSEYVISRQTLAESIANFPQSASGAELYVQNCSRCHGETGRGGRGPDLTSAKRQEKWKDSDAKLVNKITNGGIVMPAFKKKLSAEQIQSIADYVRTLKP